MGRLETLDEENRRRIEAIIREVPEEKLPEIKACMKELDIPLIRDQGDVEILYRIAGELELRSIINGHVVKTAGVDVGSQMVVLTINQCLDALAYPSTSSMLRIYARPWTTSTNP